MRRRYLMLLAAPLLASSVALAPLHVAQAGTAGTSGVKQAVKVTKVEVVTLLKSGRPSSATALLWPWPSTAR